MYMLQHYYIIIRTVSTTKAWHVNSKMFVCRALNCVRYLGQIDLFQIFIRRMMKQVHIFFFNLKLNGLSFFSVISIFKQKKNDNNWAHKQLYPTHLHPSYGLWVSLTRIHRNMPTHTYTDTSTKHKTNKHSNLIINSAYSEPESEFEDGLHSENAPSVLVETDCNH